MTKRYLALCLLLASMVSAGAQERGLKAYRPYVPANMPAEAPQWMAQLNDLDHVNYYAMVDSFEVYLRQNPEARRKTPRTKPIVNHFRRWQKSYLPYVQPDGSISLPAQADFRDYVAEINRTANTQTRTTNTSSTAGWEVISPLITYNYRTKEVRPWQANVQRFGVARSLPTTLYCGTETGMIFKSTDKGENWAPCTGGDYYFGGEITSVEVSATNPNKVLVGAGTFLWLTTDGGDTWRDVTPAALRSVSAKVRDAIFHPTDDSQMLVANDKGLYKTTDNGNSWIQINSGLCMDVKYKPNAPNTIYTIIQKRYSMQLEISHDAGSSFTSSLPDVGTPLACARIGVSEAPQGQDYIYVFACKADQTNSYSAPFYAGTPILFKSTNGGNSWEVNRTVHEKMEAHDKRGGQGYYDMVITASNTDPEKILFGLLFLYSSNDGGQTLTNKGGYYGQFDLHCDMQDIQVVGGDTWLSTDGGIIHSPDFFATTATPRIQGIYASELWGFDQGWNEDVMVGGRNHNGNMAQIDRYNGVTLSMDGSEVSTGYVFLSNPRKVAYSDLSSQALLPDNWTDPFVPLLPYFHYPYESTQYGVGMEYDPRYAKSFLMIQGNWKGDHHTLWKTTDDGNSFVELYRAPKPITSHVIARSNPDKVVISTEGGLYASYDAGQTFVEYTNLPEEVQNALHLKVAIHPTNENELWLTTGEPGGMFRTTDNGQTWQKMDRHLIHPEKNEKYIVNRFFLTGNEKNAVYAVGAVSRHLKEGGYTTLRGRILYWDNTTDGWQDYSEGLPPVITINRMLPFYKEGKIRIATNNGVWQRDLVDTHFKPIAQPLILNVGKKDEKVTELQFDSYSIVNQNGAQWQWTFNPQPISISNPNARNPIVRVADDQSYDVTLTVTTPEGSDSKTVRRMVWGNKEVMTGISGQEVLAHDVVLASHQVALGSPLVLTPHGLSAACQWQLFDASGRVVQTATLPATESTQLATLGFTPGVYFYTITNTTFRKTGKLVIR